MTDTKRRTLLKGSLGLGALALGAGWLAPRGAAAAWPETAFTAHDKGTAIGELFGGATPTVSAAVNLKAPDIAENGAVVPITVEVNAPGVRSIAILASANQMPLIASFTFAAGAQPFVSTRIKMAETADVVAVAQTDEGLLMATKNVKVTVGGCGE